MDIRVSESGKLANNFPIAVYAPGLLFIAFGIMIMLFPMLLAAVVSSIFIIIGAIILAVSWKLRKAKKEMDSAGFYTLRFGDYWW